MLRDELIWVPNYFPLSVPTTSLNSWRWSTQIAEVGNKPQNIVWSATSCCTILLQFFCILDKDSLLKICEKQVLIFAGKRESGFPPTTIIKQDREQVKRSIRQRNISTFLHKNKTFYSVCYLFSFNSFLRAHCASSSGCSSKQTN